MDIGVLLVALIVGAFIGWLVRDFWKLLPDGWPFWLFSMLFGVGGALIAVVLFPTFVGGNIIAAMIVALLGAVILLVAAWCLYFIYFALKYGDMGGGGF